MSDKKESNIEVYLKAVKSRHTLPAKVIEGIKTSKTKEEAKRLVKSYLQSIEEKVE